MRTIETVCQVCDRPLKIEVEESSLSMFSLEALAGMATCDGCYSKLATSDKAKAPPKERAALEVRQPYKD